ncbi:hypothetical protein SDC9_199419 [bioreactor metagenome]|uniref:Uncharacterized protein n=1 Tax=bioreactor metagenome TaxID=1076179 RepID=A0A645IKZ6_9ZZZZ
MWSNNVDPAIAGARFVVSDKGDILSPKYAPDTIQPAANGTDTPRPEAIPISATPTVPAVVQELPVAKATILHKNNAVTKKNVGDNICKP